MKRHQFWEFVQRENEDLCGLLIWLIGFPFRFLRRILLTGLLLAVLFYLFFVLPMAVARLAVVYQALQ